MGNTIIKGSVQADALVDLSVGGTKIKRVSDNTWTDTPVAGDGDATAAVEYYSPKQYGGFFGTVYRKYYSGTGGLGTYRPNGTVVHADMTGQVASGGYVTAGTAQYPFPFADAFAADLAKVETKTFTIGSSWTGPFKIWVDYTRS
jgi:hypothetical protein